jgi:hypothetical protein
MALGFVVAKATVFLVGSLVTRHVSLAAALFAGVSTEGW